MKKTGLFGFLAGLFIALLLGFATWYFVIKPKTTKEPELNPFGSITTQLPSVSKQENKIQNPLTGEMVAEDAASAWLNSKPLGIMINNYTDARPQAGLTSADVIYEIVAEGGITRYLAFFYGDVPNRAGPIRSTREYYLIWIRELADAVLMHIGYSPQALDAIKEWPIKSLGIGGVDCGGEKYGADDICWRDLSRNVAIEHTAFANPQKLKAFAEEVKGWKKSVDITPWKFKDSESVDTSAECLVGECKPIQIDFWYTGDYSAIFNYKRDTNTYLRYTGFDDKSDEPIPTIDDNNKKQVEIKNLIVQFAAETPIAGDDKNRLTYELVGSGEAIVFLDGKAIKSTWSKPSRDERTVFYDSDGKEIEFNRGKFWVSVVSDSNKDQVVY